MHASVNCFQMLIELYREKYFKTWLNILLLTNDCNWSHITYEHFKCYIKGKHVVNLKGKITGVLPTQYSTMSNKIHFQNIGVGCLMVKTGK